MEEFKEFLVHNWQLLASGVLFIIATVIGIIRMKKKGMTFQEILSGILMEQLPLWISMSETSGGTGPGSEYHIVQPCFVHILCLSLLS